MSSGVTRPRVDQDLAELAAGRLLLDERVEELRAS